MSPIYAKPTWGLVNEAIGALPEKFTLEDMVAWFAKNYPKTKRATVQVHVHSLTVNGNRKNKPPGGTYLLFRIEQGTYTRYRPGVHGVNGDTGSEEEVGDGSDADDPAESRSEFALELHLEAFMEANWDQINFGVPLEVWEDDEGLGGRQYPSGIGPIDFLCINKSTKEFVVLELKRAKTSDAVVGQTQRYMGWVKNELAQPGQEVRGLIIAHDADNKIKYALSVAPSIDLMTYEVSFALNAAGLVVEKGAGGD